MGNLIWQLHGTLTDLPKMEEGYARKQKIAAVLAERKIFMNPK